MTTICLKCLVLLSISLLTLADTDTDTEHRTPNPFRRRGASLQQRRRVQVENVRSARQSDPVNPYSRPTSFIQSLPSPPTPSSYASIKYPFSRRQLFHGLDPDTGSSETVIVKSLPELTRFQRDPQRFRPQSTEERFRQQRDRFRSIENRFHQEDVEVFRGTVEDQPVASALLAPVQNILPEPIPAVPHLPVRNHLSNSPFLRPVPAVPQQSGRVFSPVLARPTITDTTIGSTQQTLQDPNAVIAQTVTSLRTRQRVPTAPSTTLPTRQEEESTFPSFRKTSRGLGRDAPRGRGTVFPGESTTSAFSVTEARSRATTATTSTPTSQKPTTSSEKILGRKVKIMRETQRKIGAHLGRRRENVFNRHRITASSSSAREEEKAERVLEEPEVPTTGQPVEQQPPVTTRRPLDTLTRILETTRREEIISHPALGRVLSDDPCLEGNHELIVGQPQRSFNHHLSVGTLPPVCDRLLPAGWYRFDSPAGSLLPTECPGGNYCGTQIPVWMKGSIPTVSEGIVQTTACINQDRECCVDELNIQVRNCSSFVSYYLVPTPGCNMGYCVGEGVPCPPGLASANGYTPCDFTVKMKEVSLTQGTNKLKSEIVFFCNPILEAVLDPASIEIEIMWFVEDSNVLSETFLASTKVSGSLTEEHWTMGQTIRCEAQAKHNVVGARTERKGSEAMYAGIKVLSPSPIKVEEGGAPVNLLLTSTVPVLCSPQDRAFGECCIHLEIAMNDINDKQYCPSGAELDRVALPNCLQKICREDWNATHRIPLVASLDKLYNQEHLMALDIRTGFTSSRQWRNYVLPVQEVLVLPAAVDQVCTSDRTVRTFDSTRLSSGEEGAFTLYRNRIYPQEVQIYFRRCNLREMCHCAVSVRNRDIIVTLDICTRGYLQIWGLTREGQILTEDQIPKGFNIISINEGRSYEIEFETGTLVSLGPYLSYVKVFASPSDLGAAEGLCGPLETGSTKSSSNSCSTNYKDCRAISQEWRLEPTRTLFAGYFREVGLNQSLPALQPASASHCSCKHTKETEEKVSRLNEVTTTRFFNAGSLDIQGELSCSASSCDDSRGNLVLEDILRLAGGEDTDLPDLLDLQAEEDTLATVLFAGGPVVPRPKDGWTKRSAENFCSDYMSSSSAVTRCTGIPGVDLSTSQSQCMEDVMYTGDSRYAVLHLDRIKEDCRESVTRNVSLWVAPSTNGIPGPPAQIVDALCINDCSAHGHCSAGKCLCGEGWFGADCSLDSGVAPRVTSLINHGLCDVRTKPCTRITILGDNFANTPNLKCTLEIFKIRGVASKQLVHDLVLTSPADFLSFQEISCALPTLDIHYNKDRHRFDLRDNTDQTRMFVKVSVHYGDGARAHSLDLLLYDSQCWNCTITGECNAKTNNKCVFSAGNNAQTFRIGKSIMDEKDEFGVCSLPHDSGGCDRKEFRYYYNSLERRCKLFVYGGCKGNQNNFLSEIACIRRCGDEADMKDLPDLQQITTREIDQCSQVKDEGICPGNVPRFYFDDAASRCLLFSYGGCGGNTNNFVTEEACISTCGGPTGALLHAIQLHGGLKPRKAICELSINRGGCQARLRRFYFDATDESCKLFVFGGCQGNENNFETMEECVVTCGGPVDHDSSSSSFPSSSTLPSTFPTSTLPTLPSRTPPSLPVLASSPSSSSISSAASRPSLSTLPSSASLASPSSTSASLQAGSRHTTSPSTKLILARLNTTKKKQTTKSPDIFFTSISLPSISPCTLPRQAGTCSSFTHRYYFHSPSQTCKKFRFSGCGGNGNNFESGENCVKNCGGKVEEVDQAKNSVHITQRIVIPTMKPSSTSTVATTTPPRTTRVSEGLLTKKRKMKRVRIVPKVKVSRARLEQLSDSLAQESKDFVTRARFREPVRSRMSSSSSVVTSVSEQSQARLRRPARNLGATLNQTQARRSQGYSAAGREERSRTRRLEVQDGYVQLGGRRVDDSESAAVASWRGQVASRRIDEIVRAPANMKSGLVVIKSYCRHPPEDVGECSDSTPFYFYNVSSATCTPFQGACSTSPNKFISKQSCIQSCIVNT